MILLKNKDKKANIKIGNNIEIKDGSDFPFDLTLYGRSTQTTRSGKNLLNPNGASQNESGLTFTNNGDGSFTVEGTSTANVSIVLSTQKIKLNANQPYTQSITTVSGTKTGEVVISVKNSSDKITFNYIAGNQTITPTEDLTTYNYTYYVASGKTVNWTFKVQLEEGSTATEYEPYGVSPSPDFPSPIESVTEISVEVSGINSQSNSLTIDLQGNELCSLPNGIKDEVNITNGEALLIKRVGKVVLDGSESWRKAQIGTTGKYYFTFTPSWGQQTTNGKSLYCDYFVPSNTWSEQVVGMWLDTNMIVKTQGSLDNTEDLTSFKTWLSTHNVEVLYELAEPETINLGTVEMPHTYEGVSNITNSADTEMIVKYYKKFEFDKILRSGYNIDEQEYEIAKKQMANGKRKKILSSYVDCVIKIDLGLLDNKTYQEYKEQLEDGEYEYWSYKYNQYKKANFILTKPSITTEYAYDDEIGIDDMEITLEKSSDVS